MKAKFILAYSFIVLLSFTSLSFAEDKARPSTNLVIEANDIYVPEERQREERHKVLVQYEKEFNFDWDRSETIVDNQKQIHGLEGFLTKIDKPAELNAEDQQLAGTLFYRLGTFYAHVAQDPTLAIDRLNLADALRKEKETKAWDYNQLAYAYEQKYLMTRQASDREKGVSYASKVINDLYPDTKNKEVAFAYGVRGSIQSAAQSYGEAEAQFKTALAIYEGLSNEKDEQYIRLKNQLAETLLEQNNGRNSQAIAILEEGQKYWKEKNKSENLYAAYNLISLGQAYLKTGNLKDAQAALQKAAKIYEKVYGQKSRHLGRPYLLLAEAYRKAGDKQLGESYMEKVNTLSKG